MKITIVREQPNEWTGIYKDGELVVQGEHVLPEQALDALGIPFEIQEEAAFDENWYLPQRLSDNARLDAERAQEATP